MKVYFSSLFDVLAALFSSLFLAGASIPRQEKRKTAEFLHNERQTQKHLGQHFLHDKGIAESIVDMLQAGRRMVIEIGPGKGILTDFLIKRYPKLELVEIDDEAADYLEDHYGKAALPSTVRTC
ncbi:MAG: rRNA adenine N-6-methyltransferase family protein [Bacteroidia bacterium]